MKDKEDCESQTLTPLAKIKLTTALAIHLYCLPVIPEKVSPNNMFSEIEILLCEVLFTLRNNSKRCTLREVQTSNTCAAVCFKPQILQLSDEIQMAFPQIC